MAEPVQETAPKTFAGYELVQALNRGRLGALHLARAPGGEQVLLRMVGADVEGWELISARIKSDLDRLQEVDHPNVARPIDRGEVDGQQFYALTYPGRATLLAYVQHVRKLNGRELVWLGRGLAAGIASLHAAGLFHGDLWPGKIALTPEGPVLVELGWRRRLRAPSREPKPKDFAADWRGLGASLVYAATGSMPQSDTSSVGGLIPPDAWEGDLPGLPAEVSQLIDSLMGPIAQRPSLQQVTETFARAKAVASEDLAELIAGLSPEEDPACHETAVLQPVDSEDSEPDEPVDEDKTQTVDPEDEGDSSADAERFHSSRTAKRPPKSHKLREGFELTHKRILGKGGMGIVHLVFDEELGRHSALKLIRAGKSTENRVRRFLRELKVTARLDHPGVPPVYETGRNPDGEVYMLMQYVEGVAMSTILEGRRTAKARDEPRELLHALLKVGEAVAYAHSRRIVHRDIKPANLMIGSFGEVFVMDWGLARDLTEAFEEDVPTHSGFGGIPAGEFSDITQDGAVLGTPGYIPPEQAQGEDIDERADVYALGAVLTEILTGRPPVIGSSIIEVLELTRAGHIESPRQRDLEVSPELDAIARSATSMLKEDRYATVAEFVADLRAYLEGGNVSVYSYAPRERFFRLIRRHPTLTASLLIAVVLSVFGAVQVSRVRAEERADRHRRCLVLLEQGRTALAAGKGAQARLHFAQALALEPTNPEAVVGEHDAAQFVAARRAEELKRRAAQRDEQRVNELMEQGQAALAEGDAELARRSFTQALALEGAPEEARAGLLKAKTLLAEAEARERVRGQQERDAALAKKHLEAGRAYLFGKKRDYEKAQVALIKALAFGSEDAKPLLIKTGELLLQKRLRDTQRARKRRDQREARRLVVKASQALKKGDYKQARAAFLQALAFEGANEDAQAGLVRVDRRLQQQQSERERWKNRKRAEAMRLRAKAFMDQGRSPPMSADSDTKALEAYFAGLVAYDRALAFAPDNKRLREEKLKAVREVATFLRERDQLEFSEFLLRYGGVKQDDDGDDEDQDQALTFQEADHVALNNAFGGRVRFAETNTFPKLRSYLRSLKDRYRVRVQVRSRATGSNPPKVVVTGLWLRVEDTLKGTVYPMVKLTIEGGPYQRPVQVSARGRVVGPFYRAHSLNVPALEKRVIASVRRLVEAG